MNDQHLKYLKNLLESAIIRLICDPEMAGGCRELDVNFGTVPFSPFCPVHKLALD